MLEFGFFQIKLTIPGIGLILLVLNSARYIKGVPISGFTTFLGLSAFVIGIVDFIGTNLQLIPMLLILIGAGIIVKPLLEKRPA